MPVTASTRRLPDPTDDSEVTTTVPICDELRTCVPPQSSRDHGPPISITRTFSPYVSPNSASAPNSCASGSVIHRADTGRSARSARLATSSTSRTCSGVSALPQPKSRRR